MAKKSAEIPKTSRTRNACRKPVSVTSRRLPCPYDESIGGGADITEREAGNQCQRAPSDRREHPEIAGSHDNRRFDQVVKVTRNGLHCDPVADLHVLEWPKEGVAVTGDDHVARLAREWGVADVPDCAIE